MTNINHEFEEYWTRALHRVDDKTTFAKGSIKEFCRSMFIDVIVDEREKCTNKITQ